MDGVLARVLFVLVISVTAVQSQLRGPVNALKKVGDSVTMECVTSSGNCDQAEWMKMEGAQSSKTVYRSDIGILSGFPRERYSVSSSGGCSLSITQLEISDSGRFSCSQLIADKQETKGSVLVVIGLVESESCRSNVMSNTLAKDDGYSFRTAINVPAKSVEPSNVTLSYLNKTAGETETTDNEQPQTVSTTLTGKASNKDVMPHVCNASLSPSTADGFDSSTATLVVCTTQQLNVSYPVEDIAVSPGPYYKDSTVHCSANGYPYPTFQWTQLNSEAVVYGDALVIMGDVGDQYTCTATNAVKGKLTSLSVTIEVSPEPSYGGVIIGCVVGFILAVVAIIVGVFACRHFAWCPLSKRLHSFNETKNRNGDKASMPLYDIPPKKPPRVSETPVPAKV